MGLRQVLDPPELRRVFSAFPTGVVAIAALVDDAPVGIVASSFTSVSLDPPIVSLCVAHTSTTWPILRDARSCGISVLSADQERACRQLSMRGGDRFAALDWRAGDDGGVFLEGASAWLDCTLFRQIPAGDHDIVLLRVRDLGGDTGVAPLVFHASRFRRLEPPAPGLSAPHTAPEGTLSAPLPLPKTPSA